MSNIENIQMLAAISLAVFAGSTPVAVMDWIYQSKPKESVMLAVFTFLSLLSFMFVIVAVVAYAVTPIC